MSDAYKACPADSVFPTLVGLDDNSSQMPWMDYSQAEAYNLDVSIDSKYVVAGGYLGWWANDSDAEEAWMGGKSDWLLDSCDEPGCSEEKNACSMNPF